MPLNNIIVDLRNFVARALITNQALGVHPQFVEDIYANVQAGESYIDQIDGLAEFAKQRGLETRDVKNALTNPCFHKNFFDKRNPDNPYPWRNIFRDAIDDSQYVDNTSDTNVETIDEPPLEVDDYLEQSMAGVGIGDAYLGDNIVGPSSHATLSTRRPESAALRSPSSQVRHRYTVQSTPKNRQRVVNKSLSLSGAKRSGDGGSISPMSMRNSNTSPMPTRRLAYSSAPSPPTSTSRLKTYDKFAGKMIQNHPNNSSTNNSSTNNYSTINYSNNNRTLTSVPTTTTATATDNRFVQQLYTAVESFVQWLFTNFQLLYTLIVFVLWPRRLIHFGNNHDMATISQSFSNENVDLGILIYREMGAVILLFPFLERLWYFYRLVISDWNDILRFFVFLVILFVFIVMLLDATQT